MSFIKNCAFHVYYENGAKQTVAPKTVLIKNKPKDIVSLI